MAASPKAREERIHLRVSVGEKRKFQRLARFLRTDVSEVARRLLHQEADQYFRRLRKSPPQVAA